MVFGFLFLNPKFFIYFPEISEIFYHYSQFIPLDSFDENVVEQTFKVNFFGTRDLTLKMIPFINNNGKIINVASQAGTFKNVNEEIKNRY
jgi:NAD(P)-dependent dehydrogenase (short-subunit alcohol dehydrogenase family)